MSTPKRDKLLRGLASLAVSHPHFGGYYLEAQDAFAEAESAHAGEPQAGDKLDYEGFGREFIEHCQREKFFWDSETSEEVCEIALKYALVTREPYDPEKHGEDIEADPGCEIWVWRDMSPMGRHSIISEMLSGGSAVEKGKAPAPESMASPQSNRQHAGEGKAKTEAEENVIAYALNVSGFGQSCDVIDQRQLEMWCAKVVAERAPLVGREREALD